MKTWFKFFFQILGNPRYVKLETRLLNAICLLNGIANLGGIFQASELPEAHILVPLHTITGLLFLGFYGWSRLGKSSQWIAGFSIILMSGFLLMNVMWNAGSRGGAHYYWIPAAVISVIILKGTLQKGMALAVIISASSGMLWMEKTGTISTPADSKTEVSLFLDRSSNFLFVQLFTGCIVWILATNLAEERRRAEKLLLNILPAPVAEELKKTEHVVPRHYDETTVLFTDFVGFTKYAEHLEPKDLVGELDECFRAFDKIAAQNGLEKIKTIGDAYMAVAGIPTPSKTHAMNAINAALDIREYISRRSKDLKSEGKSSWDIRIGLHSGPLVAGVIGSHKFIYDVWGDTVNTASRMESAGLAGEINISQATYNLIKEEFDCEERGMIPIKGKEDHMMYRVKGALEFEKV